MGGRIPFPMWCLAVLGFMYLLAPIVIVVLAGLTSGEFLTFPAARLFVTLGRRFPAIR